MQKVIQRTLATFSLLALVLLCACSSKGNVKSKQAALYFGAGTQSLMDRNYTDALTNLLKANELDPNNSDIINNLGMAYYFKGEKEMAVKSLYRSLEINPKNSDARVNLASIYYHTKDFARAEKLYQEVLRDLTYDKQARTLYNLGVLELEQKKDIDAAEEYFRKSIAEDENYCPTYFQLGLIQYSKKQYNTAMRSFKDASLGNCYDSPAPHFYLGLTYIKLGKIDEARIKFDQVDTRFKKSDYAMKARAKIVELNSLEITKTQDTHASRKMLESPEF